MTGESVTVSEMQAVLDQFTDHRPRTLSRVVTRTGLPEPTVLECFERLEGVDLLVRCRGGTHTPVWKPR